MSEVQALDAAAAGLNALRPGATQLLASSLKYDKATHDAMALLKGVERVAALMTGMNREAELRRDPAVRATRLVSRWVALEHSHGTATNAGKVGIEKQLSAVAAAITRDPAVAALLRATPLAFGIQPETTLGRAVREPEVGKALAENISRHLEPPSQSRGFSR